MVIVIITSILACAGILAMGYTAGRDKGYEYALKLFRELMELEEDEDE